MESSNKSIEVKKSIEKAGKEINNQLNIMKKNNEEKEKNEITCIKKEEEKKRFSNQQTKEKWRSPQIWIAP